MARTLKQRTATPYLLAFMTFLFLMAATIALKERLTREQALRHRAEAHKLTAALVSKDELRSGPIREMLSGYNSPATGQPRRTVVTQFDEQIAALTRVIMTTKTSAHQALAAAREATARPDGADQRGLVAEVNLLKGQLSRLVGPDGQQRSGVVKELKDRIRALNKQIETRDTQLHMLDDKLRSQIAALERLLRQGDKAINAQHTEHLRLRKEARDRTTQRVAGLNGQIESHAARITRQDNKLRDQDMLIGKLRRDVLFYKELATTTKVQRDETRAIARKIVPDGTVMSDPDREGYCFIDIGAADSVRPACMFGVYAASEDSPEAVLKGALVVTRVLPDISECRITGVSGGPAGDVSRGDVVANVAFDKRYTQTFVVGGLFDLHGTGRPTAAGARTVKRIIRRHGGKVVDKITVMVDYVVLGAEPPKGPPVRDDDPPQVRRASHDAGEQVRQYKALKDRAVELHIPVLNTNRFVRDIGYVKEKRLVYND